MTWVKPIGGALAFIVLAGTSVLVFIAFDRNSHSASDTLRPSVITMAPVWITAATWPQRLMHV